jgi:hypothetical protein
MEFFKSWTNNNNQKINFSNSHVTSSGLSFKKDDKTLRHINSSDSLSKASDCSDFILDSDHCDSDHCDSDHCDSDHCDSDVDIQDNQDEQDNQDNQDQNNQDNQDQDENDQYTQTEHNTKEYYSQYAPKTTPYTLKKTGSTGDLRVYTKTDLKNKINNLEHRILMIEKRLERNMAVPVYSKKIVKSEDYGIPGIIKFAMISLFLAHLGKYVN